MQDSQTISPVEALRDIVAAFGKATGEPATAIAILWTERERLVRVYAQADSELQRCYDLALTRRPPVPQGLRIPGAVGEIEFQPNLLHIFEGADGKRFRWAPAKAWRWWLAYHAERPGPVSPDAKLRMAVIEAHLALAEDHEREIERVDRECGVEDADASADAAMQALNRVDDLIAAAPVEAAADYAFKAALLMTELAIDDADLADRIRCLRDCMRTAVPG